MTDIKLYDLLRGKLEPPVHQDKVLDFAHHQLHQSGDIYQPLIDQNWLSMGGKKPVWPGNKQFAVCLTHDVDAVSEFNLRQNIRNIIKLLNPQSQRSAAEILKWTMIYKLNALKGLIGYEDQLCQFEKWIDLEQKYDARSTFFFAPESVKTPHSSDCMYKYDQTIQFRNKSVSVAELIRLLDHDGWEIGLHPSWSAHNDLAEMNFQKNQIEQVLKHKIQSVRQHYLKYDPLTTHRIQHLAGFKYDSTLGFNDNIGFRRGTSYPFQCFDLKAETELQLMEIPLVAQDGALMLTEKGLQLDPDTALKYVNIMLNHVQAVGGVLTLSWHPQAMNYPGFWQVYKNILELLAKEDPWFATVGEIGDWWSNNVNIDLQQFTRDFDEQKS